MNSYVFSRTAEFIATADLKQQAYGNTPEEAYAKLEDSMWEFDDEPSLDEDNYKQLDPDEIVRVNRIYLWEKDKAQDEDVKEAKRWNEAHCELCGDQ